MARSAIKGDRAARGSARVVKAQNLRKSPESSAKCCKYVVSIDFGTTFSGAAFAKYADLESKSSYRSDQAIDVITNWPGQGEAGARAYCKTLTSAWYMPGQKPGTFELKGWGWTGYVDYREMVQNAGFSAAGLIQPATLEQPRDHLKLDSTSRVSARALSNWPRKYGYFLTTEIKKGLVDRAKSKNDLPEGLSLERVISDYLRELSRHVLMHMRKKHGSDAGSHKEIQYVLTVPAIWTDQQKHTMEQCFAMAGMVGGLTCEDNAVASPYDLIVVAEPEAAAVHVHKTLETTQFRNGDKFLVVDVGGGTTDVVLHEKIGTTTRKNIRVREVSESRGGLVGGSDVDEQLFIFLERSIGCVMKFRANNPRDILEINRWWNDIKCSFDGGDRDFNMPISAKLAKKWKKYDRDNGGHLRPRYDFLKITSSDVKSIFCPVVEKILTLIAQQIVPGLKAILVVGGFSESPYLSKKIDEAFDRVTKTIIMPTSAGSAVIQGAVSFGVRKEWSQMVGSRKSTRTIGFDTSVSFNPRKHREDYKVIDEGHQKRSEMCDNIFGTIIRRGEEVPRNHVYKQILAPLYREGKEDNNEIVLNMYESQAKKPLYVTDKGVKHLCTCTITVPSKMLLPKEPKLLLSVHLGTLIRATVEGKNFSGEKVAFPPIQIRWETLTEK